MEPGLVLLTSTVLLAIAGLGFVLLVTATWAVRAR